MEALQNGLAVLCLTLGGQSVSVDDTCGLRMAAEGRSAADVIGDLAESIVTLSADSVLRDRLQIRALERAEGYLWPRVVSAVYEPIENAGKIKRK